MIYPGKKLNCLSERHIDTSPTSTHNDGSVSDSYNTTGNHTDNDGMDSNRVTTSQYMDHDGTGSGGIDTAPPTANKNNGLSS